MIRLIDNIHHRHVFLSIDVVYDPSVIEQLVRTIVRLLESNEHCMAYIANTIRNPATYEQFRQALRRHMVLSMSITSLLVFFFIGNQSSLNICSIHTDENQSIEILRIN
jgi:hypothetical protein